MKNFIGIDIGGTSIKYGIVNEEGKVLFVSETPTEGKAGADKLVGKIKNIINLLISKHKDIHGIGISTAGVVDTKEGTIIYANENLPGYTGTNLKHLIEKEFSIKTIVNNDVNAAALAEAWVGAGRGIDNFFCMTLGTGIGGAIVINKKLYKGVNYKAGEIGYINKVKGKNMYYEKKASTSALIKIAEKAGGLHDSELNGKVIFEKAKAGNVGYSHIIDSWVDEICKGIQSAICLLDPGVIIIGGGVSLQKDYLLDKIKNRLPEFLPEGFMEGTEIVMAECGNKAGLIGSIYEFVAQGE